MADSTIPGLTLASSVDPVNDFIIVEDVSANETKKTTANILKTSISLDNVDNTTDLNKPVSTLTQAALDLKQATITLTTSGSSGAATLIGSTLNIPQYSGGGASGVSQIIAGTNVTISPAGGTGVVTINATGGGEGGGSGTVTSVGLTSSTTGVTIGGSPITTSGTLTLAIATASTALNGLLSNTDWNTFNNKQAFIALGTNTQYFRGDKTFQTLNKAAVGLDLVDNTSDANKPISSATQTALNLKLNTSEPALDYYITSSGSAAYLVNGVTNGTIHFEKGKKYRLHINASGHPFYIQTVSGIYSPGNVYNTGITGNGTATGYILVELPQDAPQLYYACGAYHSGMVGSIVTGDTFATYKALSNLANVDNTSDANKPVSTAQQTALDTKTNKLITTNRQTASYTLVLADADKLVEMNVATANNLTIPASVFSAGTQILLAQYGAGQTTIVAGAGVTILSNGAKLKLNVQYSGATLIFLSATEVYLFGDIVA